MNTDSIQKQILLRAPRSRVWRALTDSAEFGHWFGIKFTEPFAPGRIMHGVLVTTAVDAEVAKLQSPHKGKEFEIAIERIEPQRLFSFRWHPAAVELAVDYSAEPATLVAKDLRVMERARLLPGSRRGRESIWERDQRRLDDARRYLDQISAQWDDALARLRDFVER